LYRVFALESVLAKLCNLGPVMLTLVEGTNCPSCGCLAEW